MSRTRLLAATATVVLLALLASLPAAAQDPGAGAPTSPTVPDAAGPVADATVVEGELLVTLDAGARLPRAGVARGGAELRSVQRLSSRVALARTAPGGEGAAVGALRSQPGVLAVEPNVRRRFQVAPDDTSYRLQWAHQATGIEQAWAFATGGNVIGETRPLIAIVDSGVDATHPDLARQVVSQVQVHSGRIVPGEPVNDTCGIGHGTLVAGVAAATGDNALGVAGVTWNARVIDVALTDSATLNSTGGRADCTGPSDGDTIAAIAHLSALDEPPLVMNLSLGSPGTQCSAAYQTAIDEAREAGIVVVSSAGNSPSSAPSIPASCNGVISVAAVARGDRRASYSQRNPYVDLTAPGGQTDTCPTTLEELAGQNVLTTSLFEPRTYQLGFSCRRTFADPNGHRLEAQQGTSFSTPYVSGAVALLRGHAIDLGRPLGPDEVEALLEGTAVDLGDPGRDDEHGWGRIDLAAAVARLRAGDIPPLQPDPPFPVASASASPERIDVPGSPRVTDPVALAVAISRSRLIDHGAPYAVLARVDDFADALAGAAVGLGHGPLLFTRSDDALHPATLEELRRVLRDQVPATVYVMGGPNAIPAQVDDQLAAEGWLVERIAGSGREDTAVRASAVVSRLRAEQVGAAVRDWVFVTTGRNFADAVSAGQMAAYYGIPTLLTNPDGLHPATAAEIRRLQPERVVVVGGTDAITPATYAEVEALGFPTQRAGGATRVLTALAVFDLYTEALAEDRDEGLQRAATIAVNLRAGFTDALAATLLAGRGNWYLPLEGPDGGIVDPAVRQAFCAFRGSLIVVGGVDRVRQDVVDDVVEILAGRSC